MRDIYSYLDSHRPEHVRQLSELLAIPSVSTKSEHRKDVLATADWIADHLGAIGLAEVKKYETAGFPVVYGQTEQRSGRATILLYGHYDVQPPEPLSLWTSAPFDPTVRDGKIYARGAADDKGQVFVLLKAIEAYLRVRGSLPVNVKVIIEGEEEIGSPHLLPFIKAQRNLLACDGVLVADTHMIGAKTPSITVGLRGLASLEVTVQGAKMDLHSGSYGGAVANPIQVLAEMLVACKDPKSGRVRVPGFYDGVRRLGQKQRAALAKLSRDQKMTKDLGAPSLFGERGYSTRERIGSRPTFEINGMWGGYTGEGVKTVLPSQAHAKITMRLVADQDPNYVGKRVASYLKEIAPPHVKVTVKRDKNQGYPYMAQPDTPLLVAARKAVTDVFGKPPIDMLEGGSIPITADFKRVLKRDTVLLGFGLPDDNLHAPNEKFDLKMFERGSKTTAALFEHMAAQR